ncbi:alpha/beta hydrolase [Amycolatopsis sp. cmx-11-12]|uniref:alpha/beta hydrolase n=1 Tax=Amycolatopsis sp. cmx-11-12 TaxID=2785795 RepID=UPI0039171467
MVTWAEVTRWDSAPLQSAVGEVNAAYNKVIACSDDLRGINTADGWHGTAAGAAATEVNQVIDDLEEYAAEVASLRRSAGDVGDAIGGVMSGVKEVEGLARAHHFTIGGDGGIVDNGPPPDTPEDQKKAVARERATIAAELRDRVSEVLKSATDIDDDFCLVLDRIVSGQTIDATGNDNENTSLAAAGNSGAAMGSLSIPAPPPEGATATQNAAYWATLSEAQRTRLAMDRPELVGPRDGFSAKQRDIANRELIGRERSRLQSERDELQKKINEFPRTGGGGIKLNDQREFDALNAQLGELDKKIKGVDNLDAMIKQDPATPENQKYYLLGIDGHDDGKAILAKGNPDTAAHVASYVPGTTADLATFSDEAARGDRMHLAATRAGADSASVITWLGYDAPDTLLNAGSVSYADDGKQAFDNFQDGLRESHTGAPSHNTAIGHSYGTTLVGHAARDGGLAVNDMVFVASPGVGVGYAHQLNIAPDHVYSTTAEKDVINVTNFPRMPGGEGMSIDPLGPNPVDPQFGGKTFESNRGTTVGGPVELPSVEAHGEYWERTSPSLRGMGSIIAGQQP